MAFKPGTSGNPGGKPKERIWGDAIKAAMREHTNETDLKVAAKKIAFALVKAADQGDITALKEIGQRLDGAPEASVSVEHSGTVATDATGLFSTLEFLEEFNRKRQEKGLQGFVQDGPVLPAASPLPENRH